MFKSNKCICALCGNDMLDFDYKMPSGAVLCKECAEQIYIAVGAVKAYDNQEAYETFIAN